MILKLHTMNRDLDFFTTFLLLYRLEKRFAQRADSYQNPAGTIFAISDAPLR